MTLEQQLYESLTVRMWGNENFHDTPADLKKIGEALRLVARIERERCLAAAEAVTERNVDGESVGSSIIEAIRALSEGDAEL